MIWFVLALMLLIVLMTVLVLRGENLAHLDRDDFPKRDYTPSPGHKQVLETIREMSRSARELKGKARLMALRRHMDGLSEGRKFVSQFRPSGAGAPKGEWVLAPGVNIRRRVLYIHGGAWVAGSPRSHRTITDQLSRVANAAVFAVDYRLLPEHRYREGLRDCQEAYQWILEHGPDGPGAAEFTVVAGDSAGGSHALVLIAWIRDHGLRQADAAIALSPSTDLTLTAPSNRLNVKTDPLLGPTFGSLMRVPLPVLWWLSFFGMRLSPSSPLASPLRGNLQNLPPVLIHASDSEMLLDNARRYVNKAKDSGSPAELETWPGMVHVWHMFPDMLPEAEEAFDHIGEFLQRVEQD
ncbi:alpha/beta hydrolase [Marinobacter orientalis]|uniref:Alpha/beta hydrolase n=1 Tax=Marinobacter orientalis TaxID=1928859 RepID=A0A7Y0WSY4_9GAMM|nr:alpha/beta hydrolase [Marinobacter orientalis]NMT64272.1 alpha/beta hydrolase [Marinobacter orientalis]TGX49491.1 alpha/beta hydrolase [Marinobacter orientalis]